MREFDVACDDKCDESYAEYVEMPHYPLPRKLEEKNETTKRGAKSFEEINENFCRF